MQAQREPLPKSESISPTGLFLVTEDSLSVADLVCNALQQKGARTLRLSIEDLMEPEKLAQIVALERQIHGPVRGIVHLAPLAVIPMPDTIVEWRRYTQIHAKSLFYLLQVCAEDLQRSGKQETATSEAKGIVLAASLLGGYFGRQGNADKGLPTGGSSNGLLKTVMAEWKGVRAKTVDFDSKQEPAAIAKAIIQELLSPGGRLEVGYPEGKRTVFHTVAAPLAKTTKQTHLKPSSDWVVLVLGGARGITAEIAEELLTPGITLIVVGLSPEASSESPKTAGISDISVLRQIFLEQARSQGLSPKPIQIERQVMKLRRERAIRRHLDNFRSSGANVEYLAVDVRNAAEFKAAIDGIYSRYGRIDAVINGAGIIEDKLIVDKTLASFERVFDTKADSTFILSRHLQPESLKLLVLFSSIAGRYGNRGQSDYAAANEVLNRFAWYLDRSWSNTRVISINWGPWDSPGMASEEVKLQLRSRGIIAISTSAGRQFFGEELLYGNKGETEVVAGEGPWEASETSLAQWDTNTTSHHSSSEEERWVGEEADIKTVSLHVFATPPLQPSFPLLQSQPQLQPNSTVTLEHTFSLATDPYLQDYCQDGKPLLPIGYALEWMAEFVQAAWPESIACEVHDFKALRHISLETVAQQKVLLKARASTHADAESLQVAAEILDWETKVPFYRAFLILRTQLEIEDLSAVSNELKGSFLNQNSTLKTHNFPLDVKDAYRDYLFQGPRFQLIASMEPSNEGINARVISSKLDNLKQEERALGNEESKYLLQPLGVRNFNSPCWLFDPGLIDTASQLALIWNRLQGRNVALPSRIGAIIRYGTVPFSSSMQAFLRVHPSNSERVAYDTIFTDENGLVRLYVKHLE